MGWGANRGFNSPLQGCQSKQIVEESYRVHSTGLTECITLGVLLTFSNFSDTILSQFHLLKNRHLRIAFA